MAGDSQTGGGGSVVWAINVDNIDNNSTDTDCKDVGGGRYHQRGKDKDGGPGQDFTISIKAPQGLTASQYLPRLQTALVADNGTGRVTFTLPIEKDQHNQIHISWGDHAVTDLRHAKPALAMASASLVKPSAQRKAAPKKKAVKKKPVSKKKPARKGKRR